MPRQVGFGAYLQGDEKHIASWTVEATARKVRQVVGAQYADGWKEALKDGWRITRIEIRWSNGDS